MGVKKKIQPTVLDEQNLNEFKSYKHFDFGRVWGFVNAYNDIITSELNSVEKIKLLIDLKETINIELILNETQTEAKLSKELDKLIKPVIPKKKQNATDIRIALNDLKVDVEIYIIELIGISKTHKKNTENKKTPYEPTRKTIFSNAQLALLFNCLNDAEIIKDTKINIAFTIQRFTGASEEQVRQSLSKSFARNSKNKYLQNDVLIVHDALDKIVKILNSRLNKG